MVEKNSNKVKNLMRSFLAAVVLAILITGKCFTADVYKPFDCAALYKPPEYYKAFLQAESFAERILERPSHREVVVLVWICCNNEIPNDLWSHIILFCAAQPDQLRSETLRYLDKHGRNTKSFVCRMATTDELEILFGLIHLNSNEESIFYLQFPDETLKSIQEKERGPRDPFQLSPSGMTWLHLATKNNLCHCVKVILKVGACVNSENLFGLTPLMVAITTNVDLQMVKILLDQGADPNKISLRGGSPSQGLLSISRGRWKQEKDPGEKEKRKRVLELLEKAVGKRSRVTGSQ
jgi:hypothetical protein